MRVLIDENTAVQLLEPLRSVLPRHRVDHITEVKWQGKKDRPVLADAYSQRQQGTIGLGLALGAVIAAMPLVMEALEPAAGQQLVHINGLNPTRRFAMTDPSINPPNYWPR